uniref:DUF4058 domain-containing protein n=1 Tax=Cyanothece sp. (strain PCC 7425 / ATCC 29141) TaxID=395961 RepID=B8HSY0_CYAP4
MLSPFPGMDPYLETPELWSAVHSRLIVAMADALVDQLSERYRVEVEKRTYFSSEADSVLVGLPDVAILKTRSPEAERVEGSPIPTLVQPEKVILPVAEEVTERYLEIREVGTGAVVTVIELLSPKNKRTGEGRVAYTRKRNQILASATHLVEIDLLRGGQPFPIAPQSSGDYHILISRSPQRPTADLYVFSLRQTIPVVPVPLLEPDPEPLLNLQQLLAYVYDRGRYHLAIDYRQPLSPPLTEADWQWLLTLLPHP